MKKQRKIKFSQRILVKKFIYNLFCTTILLNLGLICVCFSILFGLLVGLATLTIAILPGLIGVLRLKRELVEYFEVTTNIDD